LQEAIANVRKHARARTVTVVIVQRGDDISCEISRERVSVAGGMLDIRSAPGEGATFTFTFPLTAAPDELAAPAAEPDPV
jgi:signal transduction histidine kinase